MGSPLLDTVRECDEELAKNFHDNPTRPVPQEHGRVAAQKLDFLDAQSVENLTVLLTWARELKS
ncbi:MAG TPA: hypothetical protein VIJ86_07540 [Acidimicrobiales bacterium]